ncbi:MAG TPA: lytic transglycosylase domain-containing protein [Chitinophagaceae bacterium]|nr:lytic transglycosylase domain-containing protein [Chitinophagaceae bacterium]
MVKRFTVLFLLLASMSLPGYSAGRIPNTIHPGQILPSDTTDILKKDSLLPVASLRDPKEGFKDLFVATTLSNGISAEQLNPLAVSFVEDYISRFGKSLEELKDWGRPYFDMMDAILVERGLPKELKYLAVIESQLKSNARSWAGAVGPWQFMPATGRNMGLKVNRKIDERRDLYKSTYAASKYLNSLFDLYGDWLLVIAAYNGGPGNVNSAIRKSGSRDFWVLQNFLPVESRNHVKKFIATHYMMEGGGGITTLTKQEAGILSSGLNLAIDSAEAAGSVIRPITGRYNAAIILKYISMDATGFNRFNPNFDKVIASEGKYSLRLPAEKMDLFLLKKNEILGESIQWLLDGASVTQASGTR